MDNTFEFTEGLNVVRGSNEAGKTTLLEAIQYLFGGAKACRTAVADMVTWGCAPNTLKVEGELEVEGVTYRIKRSSSGAEINYGESGRVVGQNEVTDFIGRLLGVGAKSVTDLMIANQNAIRGALSSGDAKTSELIETLANIKVLDELVQLIQAKRPTGIDQPARARLEAAEGAYSGLVPPSLAIEPEVLRAGALAAGLGVEQENKAVQALIQAHAPLNTEYGQLIMAGDARLSAEKRRDQLGADAQDLRSQVDKVPVLACPTADHFADAGNMIERVKATDTAKQVEYAHAKQMEGYTGEFFTLDQWDVMTRTLAQETKGAEQASATATTQIKVLEQQKVTGSVCGYCDKDVSAIPEVAVKNATITAAIDNQVMIFDTQHLLWLAKSKLLESFNKAQKEAASRGNLATRFPDHMKYDEAAQVPGELTYTAILHTNLPTLAAAQGVLADLQAMQRAYDQAAGQAKSLLAAAVKKQSEADSLVVPDTPDAARMGFLAEELERLSLLHTEAETRRDAHIAEQVRLDTAATAAEHAKQMFAVQSEALTKQIADAKAEIEAMGFNNALIKRIREVRPMVANQLWNKVLAAVSYYFGKMRGTPSVVSKGDAGFRVDGYPLASFSGSTLDALGLALRLALTKSFAPHVSMLIVDEPFAAMEDERTANSLAVLTSAGFKQVILVTHEETSTTTASNVINL